MIEPHCSTIYLLAMQQQHGTVPRADSDHSPCRHCCTSRMHGSISHALHSCATPLVVPGTPPTVIAMTRHPGAHLGWLPQAHDAHAALHEALHQVVGGRIGVAARQNRPRLLAALWHRLARGRQHLQQRQQRARLAGAGRSLRGRVQGSRCCSLARSPAPAVASAARASCRRVAAPVRHHQQCTICEGHTADRSQPLHSRAHLSTASRRLEQLTRGPSPKNMVAPHLLFDTSPASACKAK